jgi:DNA-binding XRE family transcriptional regulator
MLYYIQKGGENVTEKISIGEQIRQYRGEHDLTQVEFAEMCGVRPLTILQLEKGRTNPKASTEVKVKKVLNGK